MTLQKGDDHEERGKAGEAAALGTGSLAGVVGRDEALESQGEHADGLPVGRLDQTVEDSGLGETQALKR